MIIAFLFNFLFAVYVQYRKKKETCVYNIIIYFFSFQWSGDSFPELWSLNRAAENAARSGTPPGHTRPVKTGVEGM